MKRFSGTEKWSKPWFRALSPKLKCFLQYVWDNCDCAGVWEPDFELASVFIGAKVTESECREALGKKVKILPSGKWWLVRFIPFQYGQLSKLCKPHNKIFETLRQNDLLTLYDTLSSSLSGRLQEEEEDKEKDKEEDMEKEGESEGVKPSPFSRPTIEEMKSYGIEISVPPLDVEACFDHFSANGWRVGKAATPVKDWRACLRTWKRNSQKYGNSSINPRGFGAAKPTPAQIRNSQIIGAESTRAAIRAEAANPRPTPWAAHLMSELQKETPEPRREP